MYWQQSKIILPVSNEDSAGNLGDEAYEAMSDGMAETEVNQVVQKNTLENEMDPLTMDSPNRCPPQVVSRNVSFRNFRVAHGIYFWSSNSLTLLVLYFVGTCECKC